MKRAKKDDKAELKAIQRSMGQSVGASFSESELDALNVVIRLTLEFHKTLKIKKCSNYTAASIFSGIDSFVSVTHAYSVLAASDPQSHLQWKGLSAASLKSTFTRHYRRFIEEDTVELRLRLLLDLFKLQIAFAAVTYDCEND